MGTKKHPGKYDCYDKAEPDEPVFVLLARDPWAPMLVKQWAEMQKLHGRNMDKAEEAGHCAEQMVKWRIKNRQPEGTDKT